MAVVKFDEGTGFKRHRHAHSHELRVLEGSIWVRTGGVTRTLTAGESVIHYRGTPLEASAVGGPALVEVDHSLKED